MNNIVNIRMGHYVLAADEDAAQELSKYTEALKKRYANEEGAAEIVTDIEERIGELLQQKQTISNRNFTILKDVAAVLLQMGPIEGDEATENSASSPSQKFNERPAKRLFRDTENSLLGGVSSGFASYFNIDPVVVRLLWVVSVFIFGFGVPLYIVLWIIVPEAKTTAEKLMMKGQTPNLQNIEENVKAEFRRVEQNFNAAGGRERFSRFVNSMVGFIGKFILLSIKIVLSVIFALVLAALIALLVAFTSGAFHINTLNLIIEGQEGLNACLTLFGDPFWIKAGVLTFLIVSITALAMRIFVPSRNSDQVKVTRRYISGTLFFLFILLATVFALGMAKMGHRFDRASATQNFNFKGDTLFVDSEGENTENGGFFTCNAFVDIVTSSDSNFHIDQNNIGWGTTGRSYLRQGEYPNQYKIEGNKLTIRECNRVSNLGKGGAFWTRIALSVPKGKVIKTGKRFFNNSNYPNWVGSNEVYKADSVGFSNTMSASSQTISLPNGIDNIAINGQFEVQIFQSNASRIELISGPILSHINWIDVSENHVEIENDAEFFGNKVSVIRIYLKTLNNVKTEGVAQVWLRNIKSSNLELDCRGASHINGIVEVDFIKMNIDGVSEIDLKGNANKLDAEIDGASSLACGMLKTKNAEINISGVSTATAWVVSALQADCNGASKLYVKGKPSIAEVETNGASKYEVLNE